MGYFVREIQKLKDLCRIKSCPCYCLLLMTWFSEASLYSVMINCTPYRGKSYFSKLRRTRRFESVIAVFWTTLLEDIGDSFKLRLSSSPLSLSGFWIKIFVDLPPDDGSRAQNALYFLSDRKANSSLFDLQYFAAPFLFSRILSLRSSNLLFTAIKNVK